MTKYRAKVTIRKIDTVADPEGKTIFEALSRLGYNRVGKIRTGKLFFVEFEAENNSAAEELMETVSRDILSNPIIEKFSFEIEEIND